MAEIGDITARLRLDASQWQQGLQQATQQLTQFQQSTARLTQPMRQVQQDVLGIGQAAAPLREHFEQATRATSAWSNALQVAAGIGIATSLDRVAQVIVRFGGESIRLAARLQDLHASFRLIEGSSEGANRLLGRLFDTAQRLGVPFNTLTDRFRGFQQAAQGTQIQGEEVTRVFENIVRGARVMGTGSEALGRALTALQQVMSKGRLQAEELRGQLGEAIPGSLNLLAKGLGITTQRLDEMVTLGILPAETAVIALGNALGALQGTDAPINTLSAAIERAKNETMEWMAALGQGIGTILAPLLEDLVKISEEVRRIMGLRAPGTQPQPGASQGLGLGPLTPGTLGYLPASPYMPSEFETPGVTAGPAFLSSQYDALIRREAARIGFDPALFSRLIRRESNFNPRAASRAGALGLGQLLPETGREQGLTTFADFFDPDKNLTAAANVLKQYREILQKRFGTLADETRILLAAYNAGIGNVIKAVEETQRVGDQVSFAQVIGRLPKRSETEPYVEFITGQPTISGAALATAPPGARPALDPFAPMVQTALETTQTLTRIQEAMDRLATSGLNVGGILNDALNKQADEAVKKFTRMAEMFALFPDQYTRLTEAQRAQVQQAAQQVLLIQERLELEAQTSAEARRRVQALKELETAEERRLTEQERADKAHADLRLKALHDIAAEDERQLDVLEQLAQKYGQIRRETDLEQASRINARLALTENKNEAAAYFEIIQKTVSQLEQAKGHQLEFARNAERLQTARGMILRAEDRLEQLQEVGQGGFFGESRETLRLGQQLRRADIFPEDRERLTALRQQLIEWERINYVVGLYEEFAGSVGQAWTSALQSIANGTQTVGEAFRAMAQAILQSLAQIAAQEGFRALISLGANLLTGALAGGLGAGQVGFGASSGFDPALRSSTPLVSMGLQGGGATSGVPNFLGYQHGGIVNAPTLAFLGENPATRPETVLTRQQMQSLLAASPTAGGQAAGGITIMNYPNRATAEEAAARERSLGRQVIVNEVISEMAQGESSQIVRLMRTMAR